MGAGPDGRDGRGKPGRSRESVDLTGVARLEDSCLSIKQEVRLGVSKPVCMPSAWTFSLNDGRMPPLPTVALGK